MATSYEPGTPSRISYIRLSQEDRERLDAEAARLGIAQTELWRRMLDLYFEVLSAVPASAGPQLTPRQAESLLVSTSGAGDAENEDKFNFTGEKK